MEVVKAVILKSINYSDTQKIIQVFSKEEGFLSFITPISVFRKRNNGMINMQLMEIEFFRNEKSDLHKIKSISPFINTSNIYFDIYKMNIVLLWSEILTAILKKEQKNEDLFEFIVKSVDYLNTSSGDYANFNLFFLYRLATFAGYKIDTTNYSEGSVFNPHDGGFHRPEDKNGSISGPNTAKIICELCTCQLESLKNILLNRQSRMILLDIILFYLGLHLNIDLNTKTIRVIREVFA